MENEENKNEILLNNNVANSKNFFQLDHKGQNIENNKKFLNWKNMMITKFGKNGKVFKCEKDNIYFYTSNDDFNAYPYYKSPCPLCQKQICYYCFRNGRVELNTNNCCCLRRKIKYIFFHDLFVYINPNEDEEYIFDFKCQLLFFMIPAFGFIIFISRMQYAFFLGLNIKKREMNHDLDSYEDYYSKKNKLSIIIYLMFALFIVLIIPFFILNIYVIIFVPLISLPFKLIPLKLLLGFTFGTFMY